MLASNSVVGPRFIGDLGLVPISRLIHLFIMVQSETSSRVCVLAVPADVGVQEFCMYCGPYLKFIKDLRFLRREKGRSTVYMVCLQFHDDETAASFVEEFNGKPVWHTIYLTMKEVMCA